MNLTGKEMCEYIVGTFPDINMTPEEIWEYSPDGSIFHVEELYAAARLKNRLPAFEDPEMQDMFEGYLRYREKGNEGRKKK